MKLAAAFAAGLALAGCAQPTAAPPPSAAAPAVESTATLSDADRRFAIDAAAFSRYQVEAGRLAEHRAAGPMVRTYAALLVQQHGMALAELEGLLRQRGAPWVGGLPAERRTVIGALESLAPEVFDRRFVEQVGIADHRAAVLSFETAVRTIQDPALRAWAERTLPLLHNLLASAQQVPARVQARL